MTEKPLNGCLSNFEELSSSNNDLDQLTQLDNLLKCGICYDYFNTCVVTDCSHNFCSLCIRQFIQYKTECPVCAMQLYDNNLHVNRIVDNIISIYPILKERLFRQLRTLKTLKPNYVYVSPSKIEENIPSKPPPSFKRAFKTPAKIPTKEDYSAKNFAKPGCSQAEDQISGMTKVIIPKMFQSPSKKSSPVIENPVSKSVECPVCRVEVPQRNINLHLDDCLNRDKDEKRNKNEPSPQRKHLPKLVYRLMSINALRSKVREYGLNTQGDFETLKNRMQRFTVLYNSECDNSNPRPISDLISQLEKEEKILSKHKLPKSIFNVSKEDNVSKEELNEQYLKENKDSFKKLIDTIKKQSEKDDTSSDSSTLTDNFCQPSTSKTNFHENFFDCGKQPDDWIKQEENDIDEIKMESVCEVKKENSDDDDDDDDDDDVVISVLQKHRKKKRKLVFDSDPDDSIKKNEKLKIENTEIDEDVTLINDQTPVQDNNLAQINYVPCEEEKELNVNLCFELAADPLYNVGEMLSNKRKYTKNRKTFCVYCNREVLHFSRHLQRKHTYEECVIKFMSLEKGSLTRKRIIDGIRKRGNFVNYENDQVVRMVKRPRIQKPPSHFNPNNVVACENCKGIYLKHYISRHAKMCSTIESDVQDPINRTLEENCLLEKYIQSEKKIRAVLAWNMKADEITQIILKDCVMLGMAETVMRKNDYQRLSDCSANNLRNLAQLLITMRKLSNCKTLLDCLKPKYYNLLITAARLEAGYDVELRKWGSQTYALNLGSTLATVCDVASHLVRLEHPQVLCGDMKIQKKTLKEMKGLIESCWKSDVSNYDNSTEDESLPSLEDVKKFLDNIYDIILRSSEKLISNSGNLGDFVALQRATFLSVVLWNEGKVDIVRELLMDSYLNSEFMNLKYENTLTKIEDEFLKAVKIVPVGTMNVIFTPDTRRCLDLLINFRRNRMNETRTHLFINLDSDDPVEGWRIVSEMAFQCKAGTYKILMFGNFYKYLQIYPQIDGAWLSNLLTFSSELYGMPSEECKNIDFPKIVSILNTITNVDANDEIEIEEEENLTNVTDNEIQMIKTIKTESELEENLTT